MRQLTAKEKLQLKEELKVAQIRILLEWDFELDDIARILKIGITEVRIYVKKYDLGETLLDDLRR